MSKAHGNIANRKGYFPPNCLHLRGLFANIRALSMPVFEQVLNME